MNDPLIGLPGIAKRLDRPRGTVDSWKHREVLPEPDDIVDGRPKWRTSTIDAWNAERPEIRRPRRTPPQSTATTGEEWSDLPSPGETTP